MILILLFMSDFWLGIVTLKNVKQKKDKISKELRPIAWRHRRCWNFCLSEDKQKRNRTNLY